jgi:anti-anti-sigma factor
MAVQGELDGATVGTLEAYLNGVTGPVVLDLAGVSSIDSMGMTLLLRATKDGLTIREVSAEVRRLLKQCGLENELRYTG